MATKKASTKKAASSKSSAKGSGKRELIDTGQNKMYGKRDAEGQFTEMDDVGRSLAADRRQHAKTTVKPGYGDQGDQPVKSNRPKKAGAKKGGGTIYRGRSKR